MLGVSTHVQEITQETAAYVLTHRQRASAARAMLTMHIFLTARRGINTTGGSNEHKLHRTLSWTTPSATPQPSGCG